VLLYNPPLLGPEHPDFASEAGVLESVAALGLAMRSLGHRVSKHAAGDSATSLATQLEETRPDVIVNLCESFAGCSAGESYVAAILELLNVPYTGSPPECLALTRDKSLMKRTLLGAGVVTPDFVEVLCGQTLPVSELKQWLGEGPLMVKPAQEDASLGIEAESVVDDWPLLAPQVARIHQHYGTALIERYIAGREFTVGIIELPVLQVLPIAEIEFRPGRELPYPIVTYVAKWTPGSKEDLLTPVCCPANIEPEMAQRLKEAAIAAYRLTRCRDYARIDLRVDGRGKVYVLEVNANPDVGPDAGLARMLRVAEIDYEDFAGRLLEAAMVRARIMCGVWKMEETGAIHTSPVDLLPKKRPADLKIRGILPEDRPVLVEITRSCGIFRPEEITIADEVLRAALQDSQLSGYHVFVAESQGCAVGWSCHGRVPMTDATYDLYWIAVAPKVQGQGIGKRLLTQIERAILADGGRWLLAETSSTAAYHATRSFYLHCGFQPVSEINDFYRPGDGKTTFGKRLDLP